MGLCGHPLSKDIQATITESLLWAGRLTEDQWPSRRWNGAPSRVADGERVTDARAAGVQDLSGTQEVT